MGMGLDGAVTLQSVDHMVVSVGPYIFQRDLQRGNNCWASSADIASPPQRILMLCRPGQLLSTSMFQVAGVACIRVEPDESKRCISARASLVVSRLAIT